MRYDTAHGFAHKDLINPDGSEEKILIGVVNLRELTGRNKELAEVNIHLIRGQVSTFNISWYHCHF